MKDSKDESILQICWTWHTEHVRNAISNILYFNLSPFSVCFMLSLG